MADAAPGSSAQPRVADFSIPNPPPSGNPSPSNSRQPHAPPAASEAATPEPMDVEHAAMAGRSEFRGEGLERPRSPEAMSTLSVNSSVASYRVLHGRTYQNFEGAEYWGPNDDQMNDQMDLVHHTLRLTFDNKLFLAPLEDPRMVLDVGTGTGIWAIDFADEFPEAQVIGTDLSPIQPAWVPPNCRFELDNCELEWTYQDSTFDYIHIRGLMGSVRDWVALYRECLRCLRPGGWLEHQEFSLSLGAEERDRGAGGGDASANSMWREWTQVFRDAEAATGRAWDLTTHSGDWMREAGFSAQVHRHEVKVPVGGWPDDAKWKEVGLFNGLAMEQGIEGFNTYVCREILGWRPDEVTVMLAKLRNAIRDPNLRTYYLLVTHYTQKPLNS